MRLQVQRFGKILSGMVMPNIGAFIAWGFITALFIPTGWMPNEKLSLLVQPMLHYLLPLLIAYTGGKNVAGTRGGVIGAIAAMGVIVGSDIPMFIGAMAMGPFAGWCIKKIDRFAESRIPAGFEMLVSNFSLGILGIFCALLGFYTIGPIIELLTNFLSKGVDLIMAKGFLPLVSLAIEPAKVLFLNNAINHGVLTPLGLEQSQETGYSIMFLLEANPGSGLGVLLAYWVFSKGNVKSSAPGAMLIHFLGGIHEIYFPYLLMNPVLIIAPILGSASAVFLYSVCGTGLIAPVSPGSIISIIAMSPKGKILVILLGVVVAAIVSFLVAAPIVKIVARKEEKDTSSGDNTASGKILQTSEAINHIVFACDAGMGSSAMGATRFRNRLLKTGIHISVSNSSVDHIPAGTEVVVCQSRLASRAQKSAPNAELVIIGDFLNDAKLDALYEQVKRGTDISNPSKLNVRESNPDRKSILLPENILLGLESTTKEEAIRQAGELLVQGGYVRKGYISAMLEREQLTTTYIGMGVAIPHGTSEAKDQIQATGIVLLQYPEGVCFGEEKARLVIGLAGVGDEHLDILSRVAGSLEDEQVLEHLMSTTDALYVMKTLGV